MKIFWKDRDDLIQICSPLFLSLFLPPFITITLLLLLHLSQFIYFLSLSLHFFSSLLLILSLLLLSFFPSLSLSASISLAKTKQMDPFRSLESSVIIECVLASKHWNKCEGLIKFKHTPLRNWSRCWKRDLMAQGDEMPMKWTTEYWPEQLHFNRLLLFSIIPQ